MRFGPLSCHRAAGLWWFRVFGYGLHAKDVRRHPLLFSERRGLTRALRLGPWRVGALTPEALGR
jgi:hypothetical protein